MIHRKGKYRAVISLMLVIAFFGILAYEYYTKYFIYLKSPEEIKGIIKSFGSYSIAAFIVLQIIQVVIFFIPGEIIQIAGGYIYGSILGTLFSIIGITLGSTIVFFAARKLGKEFVQKYISRKKHHHFEKVLKKERLRFIVFFLYLIPGVPKDVLAYICGVSEIGFYEFIGYSTLGRIPGILVSALFGAKVNSKDIKSLIIISLIVGILFILGALKGKRIIASMVKKN